MLVSPCSMSTAGFDHLKDSVGAQCAVRKPREGVLPHFTRSHRRSVFGRGVECAGTEMVAVSGVVHLGSPFSSSTRFFATGQTLSSVLVSLIWARALCGHCCSSLIATQACTCGLFQI